MELGSGRHLSKGALWGLGCLIFVGMLVGIYGIAAYRADALRLPVAVATIVVGGLLFVVQRMGPLAVGRRRLWLCWRSSCG